MIERGSPRPLSDHTDPARILIVGHEPADVRRLERFLRVAGYRGVESTADACDALPRYRALRPDLVMVDLARPDLDGFAVLAQLKAEIGDTDYVPAVGLTADASFEVKRRALAAGAHDFLTRPLEQIDVVLRVSNLLKTRRLYRALEAQTRCANEVRRLAGHAFASGEHA